MYLLVFMASVMVLLPPVHMYLVVFMVSMMVLCHMYICN